MTDAYQLDPGVFAATAEEAARRFEGTRSSDPLPEVEPALLNSADLLDYIAATGMVFPFAPDPTALSSHLKPASCAIPVLGPCVFWEDEFDASSGEVKTVERSSELGRGEELTLKRNSIVYVTLEPTFRMPDYLAARFNLKIRDIYRGILVGTGPLVDPGFVGRLSIPLHNLTSNDYPVLGGEALVWMEFTKLSPNARWTDRIDKKGDRPGVYVAFPPYKRDRRTVRDYVRHAFPGPITSSIPQLVGKTQESASAAAGSAKQAAERAESLRRQILGISAVAAVVLVIGLYQLITEVVDVVDNARDAPQRLEQDLRRAERALERERSLNRSQSRQIRRLADQ